MTTTVARINKALKLAGAAERLVRGEGYYYFTGGASSEWPSSGVYGVNRASDLTVEHWLGIYEDMKGAR